MTKKEPLPLPDMVAPSQLAKLAGVPRQMIFNYLGAGHITGVRNDRWMIPREEAERFLNAREAKAKAKYDQIQRQLRGEI